MLCIALSFVILLGWYYPAERATPVVKLAHARELIANEEIKRALNVLTEVIVRHPKFWQAYRLRGELYYSRLRRLDLALKDLTQAIMLAPEEPHLYVLRAQTYRAAGDLSLARDDYNVALRLRPDDAMIIQARDDFLASM